MINDKGILIRNIYYMLSYAFQNLRSNNYEEIAKEDFEQALDLMAEILYKGVSMQLKQGLYKEYVNYNDLLPVLRGRIEIGTTIQNRINHNNLLACNYDDFSENNIFNQIIKSTILSLIRNGNLKHKYKVKLRSILPFFSNTRDIDIKTIKWNQLKFQRNNSNYRILINICYFIIDGMLMTTETGNYKMAIFTEEHMNRLFERFILEYYRKHHTYLKANPDIIEWNLDNNNSVAIDFLPSMKTDISLHYCDKTLIIDTKYYSKMTQQHYNKSTIHSGNMYQIFSYVKNKDKNSSGNVIGLLLYAKTDEETVPDLDVVIDKNRFLVRTLDLNKNFNEISQQLESIIKMCFN